MWASCTSYIESNACPQTIQCSLPTLLCWLFVVSCLAQPAMEGVEVRWWSAVWSSPAPLSLYSCFYFVLVFVTISLCLVLWLTPCISHQRSQTCYHTPWSVFQENSLMFPADVPQYVSLLSIYHWRYSRVSTDGLPLTSLWCVHLFSPTGDENLLGHYKSISPDTSCSTDAGQTSAGGGDEDWESHAYWGTKLLLYLLIRM